VDHDTSLVDLFERLERERQAADRDYNDALTALDRAFQQAPTLPPAPLFSDRAQVEQLNAGWRIAVEHPPAGGSLVRRLRGFVWRVVAPHLEAQQRFNAALVDHVNRNVAVQEDATRTTAALVDAARRQLEALVRFEWLLLQLLQRITAYVDTKDRSGGGPEMREQISLIHQRLVTVEHELARREDGRGAGQEPAPPTGAGSARPMSLSASTPAFGAATYVGFEDRFRGTRQTVRDRLGPYLTLFGGASDVVDVGCGRGELLELLREHGISARGIDTNQAMVDECRGKGLDAETADAATFLGHQPDGSLGGLIAIQVVEHFAPPYLATVLELAYRKLRPGAALALETINPACWMAFFECYLRDLTHATPLHPDTLRYLVQAAGFSAVNVDYRQPVTAADRLDRIDVPADSPYAGLASAINAHADKLNARLFSSMDYAVVARR
jgi:SAM-dependent methyltransferase